MTDPIGAKILTDAAAAVVDRHQKYGSPAVNFQRIVDLWNAYLRGKYGPTVPMLNVVDVALLSILIKIGRLEQASDHMDSVIDIAGYAACLGEIISTVPVPPTGNS